MYGIVTLLLKKLIVLAFWVIEVNVQDTEVNIADGCEETLQSTLSLHVDSLSFHRYQDASDSWKQLTISSVSVTYSSNIAKSSFLLARFQNDLILRVRVVFSSRIDRFNHSLSKQCDDPPHAISLLFSPRTLSFQLPLFHSASSSIHSSNIVARRFAVLMMEAAGEPYFSSSALHALQPHQI